MPANKATKKAAAKKSSQIKSLSTCGGVNNNAIYLMTDAIPGNRFVWNTFLSSCTVQLQKIVKKHQRW